MIRAGSIFNPEWFLAGESDEDIITAMNAKSSTQEQYAAKVATCLCST